MGQEFYKKMYSPKGLYTALYKGFRTMKYMKKSRESNQLTGDFIERIMLVVTEVNGCELCTYAHTKAALEQGVSNEEIQQLLSGDIEGITKEESVAIFFAQHYADTKGNPSKESWQRVIDEYGESKALGILGAIRMIMIGNIAGIPASAFKSRLNGKPIKKSNLGYEIIMLLCTILFIPIAFIHSVILNIFKVSII